MYESALASKVNKQLNTATKLFNCVQRANLWQRTNENKWRRPLCTMNMFY